MPEEIVPILHVKNARKTATWYSRLGFSVDDEHQYAPGMPLYLFLSRGDIHLHLSEHKGDAKPGTLLYFYVSNINPVADEFDVDVKIQPWAREISLRDPDGNRLRIGERKD